MLLAVVVPFILPVFLPLGLAFFWLRRRYMATSWDVKRYEATTRSPIYSSLSATLKARTNLLQYAAQLPVVLSCTGQSVPACAMRPLPTRSPITVRSHPMRNAQCKGWRPLGSAETCCGAPLLLPQWACRTQIPTENQPGVCQEGWAGLPHTLANTPPRLLPPPAGPAHHSCVLRGGSLPGIIPG